MSLRHAALASLALSLFACSNPPSIPTSGNGELHQGTFACTCSLTDGIAVDADFELHYEPTTPATIALEPNASFFTVDPTGLFHATRAGYGVVLVTNASGDVVDFVNLHVKTVAALSIDGVDANSIPVGQTRTLGASPEDSAGTPLGGTLALEWESSDDAIATVTTNPDGSATLRAVAPGSARIRVVAGSATSAVDIQVGGQ